MDKKDHGFTCTKHWCSTLISKHMIIHRNAWLDTPLLCDSELFDDAEKLYDRKGARTLTPIDFNPGISMGPFFTESSHL